MRTSGAIKSFENGVTTDSPKRSNTKYLATQENMQTVRGDGVHRRQPTEVVKLDIDNWLSTYSNGNVVVKDVELYDQTYWVMLFWQSTSSLVALRIIDTDGNTVTPSLNPDTTDLSYFWGLSADDVDLSVNGDTIYATNKTQVVANLGTIRSTVTNSYVKILRAPLQGTDLVVHYTDMNDVSRSVTHTVGTTVPEQGTNYIASQIVGLISAQSPNLTYTFKGSTIAFIRNDGEYSQVLVEDDEGGEILEAMNGSVPTPLHLPKYVQGENIITIQPDETSDRGTYYMKSVLEGTATSISPPTVDAIMTSGQYITGNHQYTGYNRHTFSYGSLDRTITINSRDVDAIYHHWNPYTTPYTNKIVIMANGDFQTNTDVTWVTLILNLAGGLLAIDNAVFPVFIAAGRYYFEADVAGHLNTGYTYDVIINEAAGSSSVLDQVHWEETSAPNETYKLDPSTMPQLLQREAAGTWQVGNIQWDDKNAGSIKTNKDPAFVGSTINDTAIFQNRLVTATHDEIVTTETDNLFSFYKNTVVQSLASHPVRMYSSTDGSSDFHTILEHNKDLLIFSKRKQFKLNGTLPLTPQTSGMPVTSSYTNDPLVRPLSLGKDVYFQFPYGKKLGSVGFSRYRSTDSTDNPDRATPITEHIKKYIPDGVDKILGDANVGYLYAVDYDALELYVCNYDSDEDTSRRVEERLAWSKWSLTNLTGTNRILNAALVDGDIHFIVLRDDDTIDMIKLSMVEDPTAIVGFHLDYSRETTTGTGTAIALPTGYTYDATLVCVMNEPTDDRYGESLAYTRSGSTITFTDPITAGDNVLIGYPYRSTVSPRTVYVKDESGHYNSQTSLRILKFLAQMEHSGEVYAKIISDYYNYPDQFWSGLISNDILTKTDQTANNTAVFSIGFRQRTDLASLELYSTSHLPMHISSMDWLGSYTSRGRRF